MKKKEIEVKIPLAAHEYVELSQTIVGPLILERTYGYFRKDFSNVQEGVFPRIKEMRDEKGYEKTLFTVKVKTTNNKDYFEREETEVRLPSQFLNSLRAIIGYLGYPKEIIFEKYRKEMTKGGMTLSLDKLPFGYFLELEGEPEEIEASIANLHLDRKPRITSSYLALWGDHRRKHALKGENCLF